MSKFACKVCGKVINTDEELQEHLKLMGHNSFIVLVNNGTNTREQGEGRTTKYCG